MSDESQATSQWPPYHSAPKDATFALGVISAGYSRLEFAFGSVFTAVIGLSSTFTSMLLPKIGNDVRVKLVEESLLQMNYLPEINDGISHFIAAYNLLAFNRNMLMHSQIVSGGPTISILLKTQRDGKMVGCGITLPQLRQIADDMEAYHNYGLALANRISLPRIAHLLNIKGETPPELLALPDKPALPYRLEYTSDPIAHG